MPLLLKKSFFVAFCLLMLQVPAATAQTQKDKNADKREDLWQIRCSAEENDPARECEIFQRLITTEGGQRVAEFAVGHPKEDPHARGVVILPLGILLTDDIEMQIDDNEKFRFKARYCTNQGCFAFIALEEKLLDMLKKGNRAKIECTAFNGKPIKINISLKGFAESLRKVSR
ncbi:MAG: invasion associated locus B family protein [Proteobacteria bacterium]|nr:invasion associated locus B family protein [Pseudomonadota bacterium]